MVVDDYCILIGNTFFSVTDLRSVILVHDNLKSTLEPYKPTLLVCMQVSAYCLRLGRSKVIGKTKLFQSTAIK